MSSIYDGLAFPEFVVRQVIDDSIKLLLADSTLLGQIVAGLPTQDQESFLTALHFRSPGDQAPRVRIGFGLENLEDWTVAVWLTGTSAGPRTIGDVTSDPVPRVVLQDTLSAAIGAVDLPGGETLPLTGGVPALNAVDERGRLAIGDAEVATYHITRGPDTIKLIRRGVLGLDGAEPAQAWPSGTAVEFVRLSQRFGNSETAQIRADVVSSNTAFTIVLGRIIKAFLLRERPAFEALGLTLHQVEESDMAPRPAAWPATLYSRSLTLTVRQEVSLPVTMPVVTDFDVVPTAESGAHVNGETPELPTA